MTGSHDANKSHVTIEEYNCIYWEAHITHFQNYTKFTLSGKNAVGMVTYEPVGVYLIWHSSAPITNHIHP